MEEVGGNEGNKALSRIIAAIERAEGRVMKTEEALDAVMEQMKPLEEEEKMGTLTSKAEERLAYLRKKEESLREDLRKEKEDLRKKEEDLRKKEEDLRKEKEDLRRKNVVALREALFPYIVQTPSSASLSDVEACCESMSLLSSPIYLDVIREFVSTTKQPTGEFEEEEGALLLEVLHLCERKTVKGRPFLDGLSQGLFAESGGGALNESLSSATLCASLAALRPMVGGQSARWLHQVPERAGGEVDIQLCVVSRDDPRVWAPVMVMEVGRSRAKDGKHTQASAYAINVSTQLVHITDVFLLAELVLHPTGSSGAFAWLTLTGCHLGSERRLARVPLWNGPLSAASFVHLLRACDMVAAWNTREDPGVAPWRRLNANVAISGGRVYKVFDYRGRKVPEEERRQAALSLRWIPCCEVEVECDDCVVISYPRLEGNHKPTSVGHFSTLIEHVRGLHERGVIHGDIRASNVIFGPGQAARLIDFDLAGDGDRRYPSGFNHDIEDGTRHRGATAGRCLDFMHDCAALAGLMEMVELCPKCAWWEDARTAVEEGDLGGALRLLEAHRDASLTFGQGAEAQAESKGTGSPERNAAGDARK